MCIAVGNPYFKKGDHNANRYLTTDHLANAPLPRGWIRVSGGYWYRNLFDSQLIWRLEQSEISNADRVRNLMRGQMVDCLISPDTDECSICLEPAAKGAWIALVVCGHAFHKDCLFQIHRPTCPLCRAVIVVV
jgi:hypothetical protein